MRSSTTMIRHDAAGRELRDPRASAENDATRARSEARQAFRLLFATAGCVLVLIFSLLFAWKLSMFSRNAAYKAVVFFLVLIMDANVTSAYLRWLIM